MGIIAWFVNPDRKYLERKNDDINYYSSFFKCERGLVKHCQNDVVALMVVVLTHKEMSCLVVGMFDDLVSPFSY